MFVAIQKIKNGDHLAFVAETREELENNDFITYDRIEEYEYAEMYNGVIYTDRTKCIAAQNEDIKQKRAKLYAKQVDTLHAQKTKDTIMGEWSDEKEQEYIAKVKELTIKIRDENPYVE